MHVVLSEGCALAGLENALFDVAVMVGIARRLVPVGVRRVLCAGHFHFFFCDQRV